VVKILYVCRQPFHESLQSPFPIGWSVSSGPPILKFRRICSRLSHLRSMLHSSISGPCGPRSIAGIFQRRAGEQTWRADGCLRHYKHAFNYVVQ
jgi:hypothetical protein